MYTMPSSTHYDQIDHAPIEIFTLCVQYALSLSIRSSVFLLLLRLLRSFWTHEPQGFRFGVASSASANLA